MRATFDHAQTCAPDHAGVVRIAAFACSAHNLPVKWRGIRSNTLFDTFENTHVIGDGTAAHIEHATERRIGDLHVARVFAELHCG